MAQVVVSIKIMPTSPDVNLGNIEADAKKKIIAFAGEGEVRFEQVPLAFGLNELNVIFVMNEEKGSTDALEDDIKDIEGVQSVEVTDVRRAIG